MSDYKNRNKETIIMYVLFVVFWSLVYWVMV